MHAFVPSLAPTPQNTLARSAFLPHTPQRPTTILLPTPHRRTQLAMRHATDDKTVVREYFNQTGFDRWNRIYSEDGSVNKVQMDIRLGHNQTIEKILRWVDEDGDAKGQTFCDAGCGVGSLSIPLLQRGAKVFASDISEAMVNEARRRCDDLGVSKNATFAVSDLESLSGAYDTVCCIDVMIHYPTDKAEQMIKHLSEMSRKRLIISFAPKTFFYIALKKIGELFPGPSKATRAYLHSEEDVRQALVKMGWEIKRTDFTATKFYFSKLIEAVRK